MTEKIEKIYKVNLKLKQNERVLVITDALTKEIEEAAEEFYNVAKGLCLKAEIIKYKPVSSHSEEPPIEIDISNPPDILISITHFSTSHTSFRRLLTKIGTRYVSMPLFESSMLLGPLDVDYEKMNHLGERIKDALQGKEEIRVLSQSGTELKFSIKEREAIIDGGLLWKKGDFGNLPAGEVFLAPVEGSCNGILSIKVMEKSYLKKPLIATIKEGMVVSLTGDEEGRKRLEGIFAKHNLARNIAEFGIGINDKASNPINILEAEKILGTCHIAFGNNSGFGGNVSVPFHEDYVIFHPTVNVSSKMISEHGKIIL